MSGDMYIKDRLSDRKSRRAISFPLVIAVVLVLIAAVLAIIFSRPKSGDAGDESASGKSELPSGTQTSRQDAAGAVGDDSGRDARSTGPANAAVVEQLRTAQRLVESSELQEARSILLKVLQATDNQVALGRARKILDKINIDLLTTPRRMPGKTEYIVESGDSLDRIARKYGVNIELIQESNDIKGALIHPGQRLRIPTGDFSILADKSDNTLTVFYNGEYFKNYRVGTGKHDKTPTGESKITDRIIHPTWWQPDGKAIPYGSPDNLLGTHWLALDIRGYGIHGTWEPETIGKHESEGCIRMHNEDVEELYTIIPIGTPVTIQE